MSKAARAGSDGSDRADIAKALLHQLHAIGDMARLATIHIERKHGPGAAPRRRNLGTAATMLTASW
jgi:hypothetical protein